jgi:ABC-2 type transport system ATP-binding protein
MDKGKLLALDAPAKLKASIPGGYLIELRTANSTDGDGARLVNSLRVLPGVAEVNAQDGLVRLYADKAEGLLANAMRLASEQGIMITDAHVAEPSLENLFLHLTGRSLRQ